MIASLSLSSCEKDRTTTLAGTEWKSLDVDTSSEEYILLRFKASTFELWYKDIGDPLYKDSEGVYTTVGNTVTLISGSSNLVGVINNSTITFSDDGDVIQFKKQ